MTLDEKVRLGMMAISGTYVVFATLGIHIAPLDSIVAYGYGD